MGGPGSGNHYHWWRGSKKTVVENCLNIDANRWIREGILRAGRLCAGSCHWTYKDGRECSIGFAMVAPSGAEPLLRLSYSWTHPGTGEKEPVEYHVRLATTRPRFGGLRWWFICPLVVNGRPCGRRVGKLYLPSLARYFGCRHCHDLTYTSAQEHDKRVDALHRNPAALLALMDDPKALNTSQLLLALKASRLADRRS
jgi:hypothetical protein